MILVSFYRFPAASFRNSESRSAGGVCVCVLGAGGRQWGFNNQWAVWVNPSETQNQMPNMTSKKHSKVAKDQVSDVNATVYAKYAN